MSTVDRHAAIAARAASKIRFTVGQELRTPRIERGLSQEDLAQAARVSKAEVSRVERGVAPWLTIDEVCRLAAPLGLDVSVRLFPAGPAIRDRAQIALLERLHQELPGGLIWRSEVPIRLPGDRRAWDAVIEGDGWRLAVEGESRLNDVQALERRVTLKQRDDGGVEVLLLINDTRFNREALAVARSSLAGLFPLDTRAMLSALRAGRCPGGSGIVIL